MEADSLWEHITRRVLSCQDLHPCVGERATHKPLGNVLKSIVQRKITLLKRDCSSKEPVMTALCRCDCSELVALELGARACKAWPGSSSGGKVAQGEVLAGVVEEADRVSRGFGSLSGLPRNLRCVWLTRTLQSDREAWG